METGQQGLFSEGNQLEPDDQPLASRMRPKTLDEVVGQQHVVGKDSMLRKMLESGKVPNLILYGPPGTGKTTIASVVSSMTGLKCFHINAVTSNVAELRDVLQKAKNLRANGKSSILFIDEIHRFNKSQQDLLLPDIESGVTVLIGATTHNPGFYVNPPLLSRCHLMRLEPVEAEEVVILLKRTLANDKLLLASETKATDDALLSIATGSGGDIRMALNHLELIADALGDDRTIDGKVIEQFSKERRVRYDANEDEHYDTISAFIKSIRGCDPDASLYWLAKMLLGGEDPRYIARRLVILASEDIGLADSRALPVAMAGYQACEVIGLPECEINLAHVTVFLATSPKSNRSYEALHRAKADIKKHGVQSVPRWLRDKNGMANRDAGNAKDYRYSHDFPEAISGQEYLLEPKRFYEPKASGSEAGIQERLARWQEIKNKAKAAQ